MHNKSLLAFFFFFFTFGYIEILKDRSPFVDIIREKFDVRQQRGVGEKSLNLY